MLDTPEDERAATLDEDLARFPYVNGDLFEGHLRTFSFDAAMRGALLDACRFDWSNISPAIFGALFQSVMDPKERRAQGAHYTTEKNILKVIEPLFMDDLRAEFARIRARRGRGRLAALRQFQAKLGGLTFFDPACGCGNFLIIAYRELRSLEIEAIREIRDATAATGQAVLDAAWQSVVEVDRFYGIEPGNDSHPSDFIKCRMALKENTSAKIRDKFFGLWPQWKNQSSACEYIERAVISRNAFSHEQVQPFRSYLFYNPTNWDLINKHMKRGTCFKYHDDCDCPTIDLSEPRCLKLDLRVVNGAYDDIRIVDCKCLFPTAVMLGVECRGIALPNGPEGFEIAENRIGIHR